MESDEPIVHLKRTENDTKGNIHEGFLPLSIDKDRENIPATEIFSRKTTENLQRGRQARAHHEKLVEIGDALDHPITTDESLHITEGEIPDELRGQKITGRDLEEQAKGLMNTSLLKEISGVYFTEARHLIKKLITTSALVNSNWAKRNENISLRHGGINQIKLSWMTFLNQWKEGIDLYKALKDAYPAYHAQQVGFRPVAIENVDMSRMIEEKQNIDFHGPLSVTSTVKDGRCLGLYPTIVVEKSAVESSAQWISQDLMGRERMTSNVIEVVDKQLIKNPNTPITIIDYAGGVGNSTAAMIEQIEKIEDEDKKNRMKANFHVIIRDVNTGQLEGGRILFNKLKEKHPWIEGKYVFVESDVTKEMDDSQIQVIKESFGDKYDVNDNVLIGMTSYTAGALPGFVVDKMAKQIASECYYFTAIDFSNPAPREEQFLQQTGKFGEAYLETIHGKAPKGSNLFRKMWSKSMSLGPGLAMHYAYTWPGEWGHNSGYGVKDDGTLRKSSILELGEALNVDGKVGIKSTVNTFSYLYTGKGVRSDGVEMVRLAVIPGWVEDAIYVYQDENEVPKNKRVSGSRL